MDLTQFLNAKLSFIPTTNDKLPYFKLLPNGKWEYYQSHLPSQKEVDAWSARMEAVGLVCGLISGNVEVIDIDNHKGNATTIFNQFKEQILTFADEIWHKLYIETTQSGGFHLIYKHEGTLDGSQKLALQLIDGKKDTLIETRGEGGYVVVAPSPNYNTLQGSLTNLSILNDEERDFLFEIARSFNEIPADNITHTIQYSTNSNITRPGDLFNEQGDHIDLLENIGWQLTYTKDGVEYWRRPGKNRGISATYNHIPNKLYVFSSNADPFDLNKTYDKFAIYTLTKCNGDFKRAAKQIRTDYPNLFVKFTNGNTQPSELKTNHNGTAKQSTKDNTPTDINLPLSTIFWSEGVDSRGKPKLTINKDRLINFLEYHGFGTLKIDDKNTVFISIKEHIVTEETPASIFEVVKNILKNLSTEYLTESFTSDDVWERILANIRQFKSVEFLETMTTYDLNFIKDTADKAFFFFKNGIVEVTKSRIVLKNYNEIEGYIWKEQIIDYNFKLIDEPIASNPKNSMFGRFLEKVCSPANKEYPNDRSKRIVDNDRLTSLMTAIGFLLHTYQNPALTKAVIFCEEKISQNDDANGRTGKGLTAQALSKLRKRVTYNGKQIDFTDKFFYQKITPDTQLLYFDDVKKNFDFEALFSFLTEGFSIEYKRMQPIEIPLNKTPKVLITTNNVLANDNDSHRARKFEIEFSDYFSADYTPPDEFNIMFFEAGWDDDEWNRFYNFMLTCVELFLITSLTPYIPVNLVERKLKAVIPDEFLEFCDEFIEKWKSEVTISRSQVFEDFAKAYPLFIQHARPAITQKHTTKWLNFYLQSKEIHFVDIQKRIDGKIKRVWVINQEGDDQQMFAKG